MSMPTPLPALRQSPDGYYAINNPFLVNGPKGFNEFKMLENEDMFVRLDLPGVSEDSVRVSLDPSKKGVIVDGEAPKIHSHDSSDRKYSTITGFVCTCCEISGFFSYIADGVLRLLICKKPIDPDNSSCIYLRGTGPQRCNHSTDPDDPTLTGQELKPHPWVVEGSDLAYESKQLENGSLYLRLDMPGVPEDNFTVSVNNGKVMVTGQAPAVSHDSSGRFYSGVVARLSNHVDIPSSRITTIAKDGVICLLIPYI